MGDRDNRPRKLEPKFNDLIEIFFDESKPEYPESPDEHPFIYFARGYRLKGKPLWLELKKIINGAPVRDWKSKSFLRDDRFEKIVEILDEAKFATPGFLMVRKASQIHELLEQGHLREAIENNAEVQYFKDFPWNPDNAESAALFFFIERLLIYCEREEIKPIVSFDLPKSAFLPSIEDIPSYADHGYIEGHYGSFILRGVARKVKKKARRGNSAHWINLSDGELWILQRLLKSKLPDGSSLWSRFLLEEQTGKQPNLSKEDVECIRDTFPNVEPKTEQKKLENHRFLIYVAALFKWLKTGQIVRVDGD